MTNLSRPKRTYPHKNPRIWTDRWLPANLLDAIRLLDSSKVARTAFGDEFIDSYVKLKNEEWQRFTRAITPWERDHTLDC